MEKSAALLGPLLNWSPEDTADYLNHGKAMVFEVVDGDVHNIINYRRIAGQMGGLNRAKLPFVRRIVIAVDPPMGAYGAACLHNNVHYQVLVEELPSFFADVESLGLNTFDGSGPVPLNPCAVLCLPDASCHLPGDYFSIGSADAASTPFQSLSVQLKAVHIFEYMAGLSPDVFDADRGNLAIHHGYQSLNVTDNRDDLCGFSSPALSQPKGSGWSDGSTDLADDMAAAMSTMTDIADFCTCWHLLEPLFGSAEDDRILQYAARMHPGNRAESLTMSLSPPDGECLLAHLDHLNDHSPGYEYNVSFFGYFRGPGSGRLRRMHIGMYSRRICGTTSARSGKANELHEDLTAYLGGLPKWRVNYHPGEIFSHAVWTEAEGEGEISRIPVHMNKQLHM